MSDAGVEIDLQPGNLGNKMLQYLAAVKVADRVGRARVSGIRIPEFGINLPRDGNRVSLARLLRYTSKTSARLDFDAVARNVSERNPDRIVLNIYSSVFENLPSLEASRPLFPLKPDAVGYGREFLVINVRAAEILDAVHPEYTVLPMEFYRDIIDQTRLTPVFLGQVQGQGRYLDHLKKSFPQAEFIPSRGALHDFSVIAKSKNIAIAVSTFSWLAGWLSEADRVIMPLSGFMNPLQYPWADLIPPDDTRFLFYLFPENHAVKDDRILEAHQALVGTWRRIDPDEALTIKAHSRIAPARPASAMSNLLDVWKNRLVAASRTFGPRRRA